MPSTGMTIEDTSTTRDSEDAQSTSSSSGEASSSSTDTSTDGGTDTDGEPLHSNPGEARYALVDETVLLDGSRSTGAVLYQWNFDDGSEPSPPSADPIAEVSYATPGRYRPVLTVFDANGNAFADDVTITVTFEPTHLPRQSSTIAIDDSDTAVVVSPDDDALITVVRDGDTFSLGTRVSTCQTPRTLAWAGPSRVVVACQTDAIAVHDLRGGVVETFALPMGSRPFGVTVLNGDAVVTLQGLGAVARIDLDTGTMLELWPAIEDARGIAVLPDGRFGVTQWRSVDEEARIAIIDPDGDVPEIVPLAFDPQAASDTESGGVPSYLNQLLVSPIGDLAAVPSLQANVAQGTFGGGDPLTFETTLRGVVSYLELGTTWSENFDRRRHFDNRGFLSAGVFSSRGDYLFLAARGARAVERVDTFTGAQAGAILDVGFAPEGLALTADDRYLYVEAFMSREVIVYDVSDFAVLPEPIASIPITEDEPLDPEIARGKLLFNDSFDVRLSKDGYMACAHCHLDGEADRLTWDFTDRGEGLRNTISLLGREGTAHGPIHWSANFDEIHDFENDIRGPFAGFGLMTDDEFNEGTRSQTLGDPKAGVSADLDALAAYVSSLDRFPISPFLEPDGSMSPEAIAGQALFEARGCPECHAGERLTDSAFIEPGVPLLHDVGTLSPASGQRLGGPLVGIDTPTLRGVWNSPPYLHDGSAASVEEIFVQSGDLHGQTADLTAAERAALAAYILQL